MGMRQARMGWKGFGLALGCASSLLPGMAWGSSFSRREATFASGAGNLIYLGLGLALPFVEDGTEGKTHGLRTLDSFATSVLFSEGLKALTHEKRPRSDNHNSFPSGHATAAFAIAAMQSHYHPGQSWLWYGGAGLIAASRVQLHRHFVHDVIAGSALGYFTAHWELSRRRGLLLSPFITTDGAGFQLSRNY
jgi:hypothetical protein